ncbi:MAG: hypothetical protein WBN89_03495 [Prochlorococcaceae cyanobacterium]
MNVATTAAEVRWPWMQAILNHARGRVRWKGRTISTRPGAGGR